jgi:GR25 family glycosyltransferase involved in LPS biosynthesis
MNNLSKINKCFYINLDKCTQRRELCEIELKKLFEKGKIEKVSAHDSSQDIMNGKPADGAFGCIISHIYCLSLAIERKYDSVAIFEDDIQIVNEQELKRSINYVLRTNKQWDVLLLGGINFKPYTERKKHSVKVNNCETTSQYIVKKEYMITLLTNFKTALYRLTQSYNIHEGNPYPKEMYNFSCYALDIYWKTLQTKDKWYLVLPLNIFQRPGHSDISNIHIDNSRDMRCLNNIPRENMVKFPLLEDDAKEENSQNTTNQPQHQSNKLKRKRTTIQK